MRYKTARHIDRHRPATPSSYTGASTRSESSSPASAPAPSSFALPPAYTLPPTLPSPFTPTLEASLDAILEFGQVYPALVRITNTLLAPPSRRTNWPLLLQPFVEDGGTEGRYMVTELVYLLARTLLPNQIAENRALLTELYREKRTTPMRLILRYDMLRVWKRASHINPIIVRSDPAAKMPSGPSTPPMVNSNFPLRPPLYPNVLSTLIAAPVGGYVTKGAGEKLKHHVTALDGYLLWKDGEVESWNKERLILEASAVLVHWQWLRENNGTLEDLEMEGWEGLQGEEGAKWVAGLND